MKREILEAVFPGEAGEYSEMETQYGWWAAFERGNEIRQIVFLHGKFYAETLINEKLKSTPIPIKAIHLISQYENQPK